MFDIFANDRYLVLNNENKFISAYYGEMTNKHT